MDIRSCFGEASTQSTSASRLDSSSSDSEDESEVESLELEVSPPKKQCTSTVRLSTPTLMKKRAKHRSTTSSRKFNTKWGKDFPGSNTMRTAKVPSARSAGSLGSHFSEQGEYGLPNHLLIGRKL